MPFSSEPYIVRMMYSAHSKDPDELAELAEDTDEYVRINVANNPYTSPATLAKLSADTAWYVRVTVAVNKRTPREVVYQLAHDKNEDVREAAQRALDEN